MLRFFVLLASLSAGVLFFRSLLDQSLVMTLPDYITMPLVILAIATLLALGGLWLNEQFPPPPR